MCDSRQPANGADSSSSPTTEAGYNVAEADLRDAIYRLPRGRFSMLADLDAALQQARDEGRREAVRYLHYRGTGKWPSEAGVVAALDGIDRVAGVNASESPPTDPDMDEKCAKCGHTYGTHVPGGCSHPGPSCQCSGFLHRYSFPVGASESPPTLTRCPHCDGGGCAVCFGTGQTERDASESGQPPEASDE